MKAKWIWYFLLLGVWGGNVHSQLSDGRPPLSWQYKVASYEREAWAPIPNVDSLKKADIVEQELGLPYRFGFAMPVDFDLWKSGNWHPLLSGGSIWTLRINADDALSINLNLDSFYLPPGACLWVYDEDHSYYLGAFTYRNNNHHGNFATIPVSGDHLILELYEPAYANGLSRLHIHEVVYGYKENKWAKGFGQSGSCNVNINCPEGNGWENERQAVVMLLTSGNTRKCSGTMVNNTGEDGTPYLLTARHCNTQTDGIFMFNYQSPDCTPVDGPTTMVLQGCDIVAENPNTDVTLLRLLQTPPPQYGVFFAGWTRDSIPPLMGYGIHHPNGDIKKFSVDSNALEIAPYLGTAQPGGNYWRVVDWNTGTTEAGSSGSCLLDPNHRIRGQLRGGFASCSNDLSDYYSRFDISWGFGADSSLRLSDWLDPLNMDPQNWDGKYIYTPFYDRDVELLSFVSPGTTICDTAVTPLLKLTSWGRDTVTALRIAAVIGNDTTWTNWSGNLGFNDTVTIALNTMSATMLQSYSLQGYVVSVNNLPDEYVANDTASTTFQQTGGASFKLYFKTDNAPLESSWTLKNEYGTVVKTGSYTEADSLYIEELCLESACYTLEVQDAGNNGLCCTNGSGYLELKDESGNMVAFHSAYGTGITVRFCYPDFPDENPLFRVFPVPNNGDFNIIVHPDILGESLELKMADVNGKIVAVEQFTASYYNTFSIPLLAAGVYHIYIYSDVRKEMFTQKVLIIR